MRFASAKASSLLPLLLQLLHLRSRLHLSYWYRRPATHVDIYTSSISGTIHVSVVWFVRMTGLLWDVVVLCMPVCWTMRGVLYISADTLCSFVQQMFTTVTLFSYNKTGHFLPSQSSVTQWGQWNKKTIVFGQRCGKNIHVTSQK